MKRRWESGNRVMAGLAFWAFEGQRARPDLRKTGWCRVHEKQTVAWATGTFGH